MHVARPAPVHDDADDEGQGKPDTPSSKDIAFLHNVTLMVHDRREDVDELTRT